MIAVYCLSGKDVAAEISSLINRKDVIIVPVECEEWNRDYSPWPASKVFPKGEDFTGGADRFLAKLTENIIPGFESEAGIAPSERYLAGYSLAGLFSVYASTRTDKFDGVASMSGSLWFDGFVEYLDEHPPVSTVKKAYLSLGDREKKTGEPRMKTVEDCSVKVYDMIRSRGIDSVFELNPGNHFTDITNRIAKGIRWLTEERHERSDT